MDVLEVLYKAIWAVIYLGIAAGIAALAWVTIRFNLKRRDVRSSLSPEPLSEIVLVCSLLHPLKEYSLRESRGGSVSKPIP